MSEITHYSDAEDNEMPKRFLCRRKVKCGMVWTRAEFIVDCPQCLERLRGDTKERKGEGPANRDDESQGSGDNAPPSVRDAPDSRGDLEPNAS